MRVGVHHKIYSHPIGLHKYVVNLTLINVRASRKVYRLISLIKVSVTLGILIMLEIILRVIVGTSSLVKVLTLSTWTLIKHV